MHGHQGTQSVLQDLDGRVSEELPAGTKPQTDDVVAAPPGDPRGSALASSILPIALAGVASGAAVTVIGLRGARAATALAGTATPAGVVATAIAHDWLGVLTGSRWAEAGVFGSPHWPSAAPWRGSPH